MPTCKCPFEGEINHVYHTVICCQHIGPTPGPGAVFHACRTHKAGSTPIIWCRFPCAPDHGGRVPTCKCPFEGEINHVYHTGICCQHIGPTLGPGAVFHACCTHKAGPTPIIWCRFPRAPDHGGRVPTCKCPFEGEINHVTHIVMCCQHVGPTLGPGAVFHAHRTH